MTILLKAIWARCLLFHLVQGPVISYTVNVFFKPQLLIFFVKTISRGFPKLKQPHFTTGDKAPGLVCKKKMGHSTGYPQEVLESWCGISRSPRKSSFAWRIIPLSKWLVTPIYKPFRPFVRGTTLLRGLTITMVINHLLTGMILQVGGKKPDLKPLKPP